MKKNNRLSIDVSLILPMRNSATTILYALHSIQKQDHPISEIIIIDNASVDNSVEIVKKYKKNSQIPITVIERKKNKGIAASYNTGIQAAKSEYVVLMHSDVELSGENELSKLLTPFQESPMIVATYPSTILPKSVWITFSFWEKCMMVHTMGKKIAGLNGKFDCIKRSVVQSIGGFDEINFPSGGEDADLHRRLAKVGKVVLSNAVANHLHFLGKKFTFTDWLRNRKIYAGAYGRFLRMHSNESSLGDFILLIKPMLAVLPFIPYVHLLGIILLLLYAVFYSREIFVNAFIVKDWRIFLIPFISIFLIYFELYWMIKAFLYTKKAIIML